LELKRSIFEAPLHFRVFTDRSFKGMNNKDLKLYWQILSQISQNWKEKILDVDRDEKRHTFLKLTYIHQ